MNLGMFVKNRNNQKVLGLSAILTVLVMVFVVKFQSTQHSMSPTLASNTNGAQIYFSPSLLSLTNTSGRKNVDVVVDSKGVPMSSITVKLAYDPKKITNMSLSFPNFGSSPLTNNFRAVAAPISQHNGILSFTLFVLPIDGNIRPITAVSVATLSFTVNGSFKPGDNLFSFLPNTAVYAATGNGNSSGASVASFGSGAQPQSILKLVQPVQAGLSNQSAPPPPPPPPPPAK